LPQRSGEVAGERGHDQPVGGLGPRAGCLTAQHADLMAEQDQFHVLRPLPAATHHDQSEQPAGEDVEQHAMILPDARRGHDQSS
jgi:hypothetical protein